MKLKFFLTTCQTHKRFFSLIELLLVIGVLVTIGSSFGFGIFRSIQEANFSKSVRIFKDKLRLGEEIAFDYNTEIAFVLTQQEKGIKMFFSSSHAVPKHLQKAINAKNFLKGFMPFTFNGTEKTTFVLTFYPYSGWRPSGNLSVTHSKALFFMRETFLECTSQTQTPPMIREIPYPKEI